MLMAQEHMHHDVMTCIWDMQCVTVSIITSDILLLSRVKFSTNP